MEKTALIRRTASETHMHTSLHLTKAHLVTCTPENPTMPWLLEDRVTLAPSLLTSSTSDLWSGRLNKHSSPWSMVPRIEQGNPFGAHLVNTVDGLAKSWGLRAERPESESE